MAKYKRRKDGLYQANVQIGIDPITQKRKFKTVYASTIDELDLKRAEVRKAVKEGTYSDDRCMTVAEWADRWFNLYHSTSGIRTKEMYHRLVYSFIVPEYDGIRLQKLKKSDIQQLINKNWEFPRTCEQLSMCIKQLLNAAIDDGLIYKNVCTKLKLPPVKRKEQRALTVAEKQAVKYADLTLKQKVFIKLLELCGLRLGEVLALDKSSFDFQNQTVHIDKAVTFSSNLPILKEPKTAAGYRTINLPDSLAPLLNDYFPTINSNYLFTLVHENKNDLTNPNNLMTKSSYRKFFLGIMKAFKDYLKTDRPPEGLTSRTFRYNFATILYYSTIDLKEAQRILGHSDIKITLEIYTALDPIQSDSKNKIQTYLDSVYDPDAPDLNTQQSA